MDDDDTTPVGPTWHSHPKEWTARKNMISRCYNPKSREYRWYGARGIGVCDRWRFGENGKKGFVCFVEDMGPPPSDKHSLERPDGNKDYGPGNGIWATRDVQIANRSNTVWVEFNGERMPLARACKKAGLGYTTVQIRRRLGWPESDWFLPKNAKGNGGLKSRIPRTLDSAFHSEID